MATLRELKQKDAVKHGDSYADFDIPESVGNLMDLLHYNEQKRSGFVTKKRILDHRDD